MRNGQYTGEMGYKLYKYYENADHAIYYDHGKDKNTEPNLCQPTPFFDTCSRTSTLSHVDIAAINKNSNLVKLIAEIEEAGAEPKKVIGDIVNIVLSDQVRIQGKDYQYDGNLILILGIKATIGGGEEEKTKRISRKLMDINKKTGNKNIELVLVFDIDLLELVKKVESEIKRRLAVA